MSYLEEKYKKEKGVGLPNRQWPNKTISASPIWCAVDLRDGNQALINPMDLGKKIKLYNLLVDIGFKEIEIGFPSASEIDFDFTRKLVEDSLIPNDVTPQVLVPAREHLIQKTFESLEGVKKATIHLYNSTSIAQRRDVFNMSRQEIIKLACDGAKTIKKISEQYPDTDWSFQYSPESFTGTELEFAVEICNEVLNIWKPTLEKKVIINLPATIEVTTPNVYADQIEWMAQHLNQREALILSVHTHNDRGCGIAAAELGVLAGADRVEGTLFGNGERTGNADLVTLALNLYSQGIDPKLNFSHLPYILDIFRECTELDISVRHPYAGELVFTAFSGSHQDAIKKGINAYNKENRIFWDIPYIPIDPQDIGRVFESSIRINSQSGKGGTAYVLEEKKGYILPKKMQIEFYNIIQSHADKQAKELPADIIVDIFEKEYLNENIYQLKTFSVKENVLTDGSISESINAIILDANKTKIKIEGEGNGPIDAFIHGLQSQGIDITELTDYSQHTLSAESSACAVAYIALKNANNKECYGVGIHENTNRASILAILSALTRLKHPV